MKTCRKALQGLSETKREISQRELHRKYSCRKTGELFIFRRQEGGESERIYFFEKLTSAWKPTFKISSRFQQRYSFGCAWRRKLLLQPSHETFSLTFLLIFSSANDEHLLQLKESKVFYLIIQSMFYKKLLLFFSYAWQNYVCVSQELCHREKLLQRSIMWYLRRESYKLHSKLLHRIEY